MSKVGGKKQVVGKNMMIVRTTSQSGKPRNNINRATPVHWLGGENIVKHKIKSEMDYLIVGESGLSRESIDELTNVLGVTRKKMAEDILNVSVKTIERKSSKAKFNSQTSSHAIEIAKLVQHTYEVFQDEEKVKSWLNTPHRSLRDHAPVDLMKTMTGLRMIDTILVRIEEGIYS
jgi:putative toxin-antitoxin system antitoxin component (TIGR02293 family)